MRQQRRETRNTQHGRSLQAKATDRVNVTLPAVLQLDTVVIDMFNNQRGN